MGLTATSDWSAATVSPEVRCITWFSQNQHAARLSGRWTRVYENCAYTWAETDGLKSVIPWGAERFLQEMLCYEAEGHKWYIELRYSEETELKPWRSEKREACHPVARWYCSLRAGELACWLTWLLLAHKSTLIFVALWKIFKSSTLLPEAVLRTVDGRNYMITL